MAQLRYLEIVCHPCSRGIAVLERCKTKSFLPREASCRNANVSVMPTAKGSKGIWVRAWACVGISLSLLRQGLQRGTLEGWGSEKRGSPHLLRPGIPGLKLRSYRLELVV